jgi:hypothetical protein
MSIEQKKTSSPVNCLMDASKNVAFMSTIATTATEIIAALAMEKNAWE